VNPDIQTSLSPWVLGGLILVGTGLVGAGIYYIVPAKKEHSKHEITRFSSPALPDDYFNVPEAKPQKKTDPKKITWDKATPNPKLKQQKATAKKRARLAAATPQVQAPYVDYKKIALENKRKRINQARMGSTVSMSALGGGDFKPSYTNTQENYEDSGLNPKYASFPVDLSRTITQDRNISAVLIEEINSELSGKITALIDHNVYSAHGRNVLIPTGSKAVGVYQKSNNSGQRRIQAIWNRIITPNGISINIAAPIADAMGRTGLGGNIDNRLWERFGLALLVSTISAGGQMNIPVNNQNQAVASNALSTQLSQVSQAVIQQNFNLNPIITIPAGKIIQISIQEDIWFRKPIKNSVEVDIFKKKGRTK